MELLVRLAGIITSAWVVSGMFFSLGKMLRVNLRQRFVWHVWAELRPLYLPAVAILVTHDVMTGNMLGWRAFVDACHIINWFYFRNVDEDDRWKRRRRKLAEKIEQRGGRLVAVPATGGP